MALVTVPGIAQKAKEKSDKKASSGDHQTIVINRHGKLEEKTVIEIVGDKVLVNGKETKDNGDVTVNVNTLRPGTFQRIQGTGPDTWVYSGTGRSLFTLDSNRAMLGVITDMHPKGALIDSVSKDSPAEKAGLLKGDVITKIGTQAVKDAEDVTKAVRAHKPGDKVAIEVLRNDQPKTVTAELTMWKGMKFGPVTAPRINIDKMEHVDVFPSIKGSVSGNNFFTNPPKLGLSVQDTEDGRGVKVTEVDTDSHAAKAGIKVNDIITHIDEKAVNSADETARIVRASREKPLLKVQLLRDGKPQSIDVKIPRKLKTADL
jgi:serine protease Do